MQRILGVDGGGTKTAWILLESSGSESRVLDQGKLPASNFRLTSGEHLRAIFNELPREVDRAGIFLAGCVTIADYKKLAAVCKEVWAHAQIVTGSDRDSGVAAALQERDGIAVNAGTGSSITGQRTGRIERAGGWGHILGDAGGGYYLSLQALRLTLREYDLRRGDAELAAKILRALCLNNLDDLVRWAQTADKMEIATLAPLVFKAAENGDARVREILDGGASVLAEYTAAVARRLDLDVPQVRLLGGLFRCCAIYAAAFQRELAKQLPAARVEAATHSPEWGAAWLAANRKLPQASRVVENVAEALNLRDATTEQRNPRSETLDQLSAAEFVDLFVSEERFVQSALHARRAELAKAIDCVTSALRDGGRLFYVGAGTSGRLGVLEASEIPPTFGAEPDLVQGIIAGGVAALHRSVEGAEDMAGAGSIAIHERGVGEGDIVCGITASGRTPFVMGALARAKELGAQTILVTCNSERDRPRSFDVEIDLPTGPELLSGSTRLKAGTATKVALNIITTGAMVALGKVRGNLMIDLRASNAKLRDRAARLVADVANCTYETATKLLTTHGWDLRAAIEAAGPRQLPVKE
ncbi:MAG: N-acetylmuramic acid 6-phosphate etherase [Chthoniobacterales bacterium]